MCTTVSVYYHLFHVHKRVQQMYSTTACIKLTGHIVRSARWTKQTSTDVPDEQYNILGGGTVLKYWCLSCSHSKTMCTWQMQELETQCGACDLPQNPCLHSISCNLSAACKKEPQPLMTQCGFFVLCELIQFLKKYYHQLQPNFTIA